MPSPLKLHQYYHYTHGGEVASPLPLPFKWGGACGLNILTPLIEVWWPHYSLYLPGGDMVLPLPLPSELRGGLTTLTTLKIVRKGGFTTLQV